MCTFSVCLEYGCGSIVTSVSNMIGDTILRRDTWVSPIAFCLVISSLPPPPLFIFFNYMGVSAATLFAVPFLLIALFCLQAARLQYLKLFIAHLVSHHVSGVSSWIKSKHQLEPDRMANVEATSLPAASHSMVLVTAADSV